MPAITTLRGTKKWMDIQEHPKQSSTNSKSAWDTGNPASKTQQNCFKWQERMWQAERKSLERPEWRLNKYCLWRWQDSQEHRKPSLTHKSNWWGSGSKGYQIVMGKQVPKHLQHGSRQMLPSHVQKSRQLRKFINTQAGLATFSHEEAFPCLLYDPWVHDM